MATSTLREQSPRVVKWTREKYLRMAEMGLFDDVKVELIYGEIIEKMGMNPPHAWVLEFLHGALIQIFAAQNGYRVRCQSPFLAADESLPEPDLLVARGERNAFQASHPSSAVLVIEVSDSTLPFDLNEKAALYAQSEVPEYWVVDVRAEVLHVHTHPIASQSFEKGFGYQTVTRLTKTDSALLPEVSASLRIAEFFPSAA